MNAGEQIFAAFLILTGVIAVAGMWESGAFPIGKWRPNLELGMCDFHPPGSCVPCYLCYTRQARKAPIA